MNAVSGPEVRAARSFLRANAKAGTADIPPRKFAQAAKDLKVGFRELYRLLAAIHKDRADAGTGP